MSNYRNRELMRVLLDYPEYLDMMMGKPFEVTFTEGFVGGMTHTLSRGTRFYDEDGNRLYFEEWTTI